MNVLKTLLAKITADNSDNIGIITVTLTEEHSGKYFFLMMQKGGICLA